MTLPNLFQQLSWIALLIPLIGLVLSFSFRTRRWVVFIWMPTMLFLGYAALWTSLKLAAFRQVRGPDAIGVGFAYIILLPALGVALLGLVACFFARPRREAWRLPTALPAVLVCIGLVVLVYTPQGAVITGKLSVVRLRLIDAKDHPLPRVAVRLVTYEDGLSSGGSNIVSDPEGSLTFKLRQRQSVSLELHHPFPPSGQLSDMPTFWNMGLTLPKEGTGDIVIRHSWQRSVGSKTLNEAYTETIPAKNLVDLTVVLPPHSGLVVPALRNRIHAALLALRGARSKEGYEYLCRNVEAVEFIPWLIETYHSEETARASLVEGLAQTASILSELDQACGALQDVAANPSRHNKNYIDGEFAYEAAQIIAWAGASDSDRTSALVKVRTRIGNHAKTLWEFVATERPQQGGVLKIFGELGQLGRPGLPALINSLLEVPPKTIREVQQWGPSLWRTVPRKTRMDVMKPLWESENPLLVLLACEVMGNQLEADAGTLALNRLEAVRPAVKDRDTLQRMDMYIGMFRPKK